jgi:hypothetical protein
MFGVTLPCVHTGAKGWQTWQVLAHWNWSCGACKVERVAIHVAPLQRLGSPHGLFTRGGQQQLTAAGACCVQIASGAAHALYSRRCHHGACPVVRLAAPWQVYCRCCVGSQLVQLLVVCSLPGQSQRALLCSGGGLVLGVVYVLCRQPLPQAVRVVGWSATGGTCGGCPELMHAECQTLLLRFVAEELL